LGGVLTAEGRAGHDEWRNPTVTLQAQTRAKTRHHQIASLLALTAGLLAVAGCGSSSKSTSSSTESATPPPASTSSSSASTPAPAPSASSSLSVAANPEGQLKYEPASLTAKAGKVSINFTNMASLEHDLTVASPSGAVLAATSKITGSSQKLFLNLNAGTYK